MKEALEPYYNQKIIDRDRFKVVARTVTEAVSAMVVEGKVAQGREVAQCVVALVLREMLPPPPPPPHPRPPPPSPPRCAKIWGSPFDSPYE